MPCCLSKDSLITSTRGIGYADDTTVYSKAKSIQTLTQALEKNAKKMLHYCISNGRKINSQITQMLTIAKQKNEVKISKDMVQSF